METTSVVIVTHQSAPFIGDVLEALADDPVQPDEIIVVDSGSSDSTLAIVAGFDVRVVARTENIGFVAGCHEGAALATGSMLVFLGHDTIPEQGWLQPLVDAASTAGIGAAMATIVDAESPSRFNTSGGHLTYVGLAWVSDLGELVPDNEPELIDVAFPSGSAMAISAATWARFHGYRRSLFMYHEDTDLGWRLRLAGLRVVRSSRSRVAHRYAFSRSPDKMYHLERNRWILILTNYRPGTIAVLMPAFLLTDLGTWVVAARDGWLSKKLAASVDLVRTAPKWRRDRTMVDANRSVADADILATMHSRITTVDQIESPPGSEFAAAILARYLSFVLPLIRLIGRLDRRPRG